MFAAINIPRFALQAVLRHEPELAGKPVALVDPRLSKPVIVEVNASALRQGVVVGLTASQAMARCAGLVVKTRSSAQEEVAAAMLLQAAYAFSPNIEATAPGVCTVALKGLGLGSKDFPGWAAEVRGALAGLRLDAAIGVAATPGLALLAAREANPVLHVEEAKTFAAALPVSTLQPPPEVLELLARWGIRTVGEFLALGRDHVADRLGRPALEMFERVSTGSLRPLKLVPPPEEFVEEMEFEHEIETAAPLLFVLRRFVEQILRRLDVNHLVVAEFRLRLGLSSGAAHEQTYKIPSPTGDIETLFRTLHTSLENLRTDSTIVSLRLEATPGRPEQQQLGLFEPSLRDPNQFAETLARLMALCGPDRVGTPVIQNTHRPDAFSLKTPDFLAVPPAAPKEPPPGLQLRRFRPAVSATVEFRQKRPALMHSPAGRGAIHRSRGPFLGSGGWWDRQRWAREEWDVQTTEGALFRIVFTKDGCEVEGVYD